MKRTNEEILRAQADNEDRVVVQKVCSSKREVDQLYRTLLKRRALGCLGMHADSPCSTYSNPYFSINLLSRGLDTPSI